MSKPTSDSAMKAARVFRGLPENDQRIPSEATKKLAALLDAFAAQAVKEEREACATCMNHERKGRILSQEATDALNRAYDAIRPRWTK